MTDAMTTATLAPVHDAHLRLAAALYSGLFEALLATPATDTAPGWTLRPDRLNAHALRFDWLTGPAPDFLSDGATTARAHQVLHAASRIATDAGFRVRRDGSGLYLTPA